MHSRNPISTFFLKDNGNMANFTEQAIKNTFIDLLNEKPLNQITVKDIVVKCGINRNSFYYHFQDIPNLLETIVKDETDQIMKNFPSVDSLETAFEAALTFALKNRRAALNIFNSASRDLFEQHLWNVCNYTVDSFAKNVLAKSITTDKPLNDQDAAVIHKYYVCQLFGTVTYWLENKMPGDIIADTKRTCELQKGVLEYMISNISDKKKS